MPGQPPSPGWKEGESWHHSKPPQERARIELDSPKRKSFRARLSVRKYNGIITLHHGDYMAPGYIVTNDLFSDPIVNETDPGRVALEDFAHLAQFDGPKA